jgi:succinoglycan biosynthesis transport protein ExoP
VLIDTPPLLPVTEAAILAKITGSALVVVGADLLSRQQRAGALGSLETVGARVLGGNARH